MDSRFHSRRRALRVRSYIPRASEFGVIGYGIQLGPNAFYMFDRLGVSEAVVAQSIIPRALLMLNSVDAESLRASRSVLRSMNGSSVLTSSFIGSTCIAFCSMRARRNLISN